MARPLTSRHLLFICFVLFGAVSGFFIGSLSHALAAAPVSKGDVDITQHNSLIVLVDSLDSAQPVLKGVWLAARSEDSTQINWMPIYPLPLDDSGNVYAQAHKAISLSSNGLEGLAGLTPIRDASIWYDEVFMLDEAVLNAISAFSATPLSGLSATWVEPQGALQEQVQAIQSLCAFNWSAPAALDQILALMPTHFRSSLNPVDLIARWDNWAQSGYELACTHPWAN